MKYILIVVVILSIGKISYAQQTALDNFNAERQKISTNGLKFVAGYAAANIIYGTIASSNATGSNKYFNSMNAIWNGVTLGLVGIGYLTAKKEGSLSLQQTLLKQHNIEKLFLLNAGLDVSYVAGGAYLREHSKVVTKNSDKLKGYGESVMLQGGVLLLFDGIMYGIHNKHGKKLNTLVGKIQLASTANGVGLVVKL